MKRALAALAPILLALPRGGSEAAPAAPAFSFTNDVLPVLQRAGCASAYCHGSATGRGGFKLSLFGSDPKADYEAIAHELDGRRIDRVDAEQSLLLKKPAQKVAHGGGRRLRPTDAMYRTLRTWIDHGAPWREGPERSVRELSVQVEHGTLRATARFDDDTVRDVSELALFTSSDPEVAAVDENGRIEWRAAGEAWLFARHGNQSARVAVCRPFAPKTAETSAHPLDRAWLARLASLGLDPAPAAAPATLVRRLYLDLAGRPPAPHECGGNVADPDTTATLVTALLGRPEFAQTFGAHVAAWFEARNAQGFVAAIERGESLPAIARLALERDLAAPAGDPRDRAEHVARAFLGLRIGCARCHDHPLDRWRQREHLAFSACFADPRPAPAGGMTGGKLFDPETGEEVPPRLLPLRGPAAAASEVPRAELVRFVLDEDHAMLARNVANRLFATLLGRGLVETHDDHRLSNPAVHEPVLDALVAEWRRTHGDLRALVRMIVTSRLYAASSEPARADAAGDAGDAAAEAALERARVKYFARREARPMGDALLARSLGFVLGVSLPARVAGTPLARQLALQNGPLLHEPLGQGGTLVDAIADVGTAPERRIDELYQLVLARGPRPEERARFGPALQGDDARGALRELAFALLAGREFSSIR